MGDTYSEVINCVKNRVINHDISGSSLHWEYGKDYKYLFNTDPNHYDTWNRFVFRECMGAGHMGFLSGNFEVN